MDLGLKNLVALVAGSSRGLGFAAAKILLEEGAFVVINGRKKKDLEAATHLLGNEERISSVEGDVTKKEDCRDIIGKTTDDFGRLDILITNSGGPPPGSFESLDEKEWRKAIDLSFMSHMFLIDQSLKYLKESDNPTILTVTSFTVRQPMENMILSNSIRAATVALTKSLSFELGRYGIRVNSILPGWTFTDRVSNLLESRAKNKNHSIDEEIKEISEQIPLSRMGKPEEFGRAAAFLVSPAASFINGVMLNVDGGSYQGLL